jgi:hypothetical protein
MNSCPYIDRKPRVSGSMKLCCLVWKFYISTARTCNQILWRVREMLINRHHICKHSRKYMQSCLQIFFQTQFKAFSAFEIMLFIEQMLMLNDL